MENKKLDNSILKRLPETTWNYHTEEDFEKFWDLLQNNFLFRENSKYMHKEINKYIDNFFELNIGTGNISEKLGNSICKFMKNNIKVG